MEGSFIIGCLVGIVIILLPGAIVLRSLRFSLSQSLVYAPSISIALFTIAGITCHLLSLSGVLALSLVTLLITLVFGGACLLVPLAHGKRSNRGKLPGNGLGAPIPWRYVLLYAMVNVIMMGYLFLVCLNSLDAIIPIGDVNYHVNVVKSMMDSGDFSTLSVSPYPDATLSAAVPFDADGYYPAAWHVVTALLGSVCSLSAPLAENVSNYLFTAIVFPLGILALLKNAFPEQRAFVFWGAFVVCAGAAFPLRPLLVHQIYPNVAGFACLPSVIALLYITLSPRFTKSERSRSLVAFFIGFAGLALLHPNVFIACCVFVFALILCLGVPQVASAIAGRSKRSSLSPRGWSIILGACWIAFAVIVWLWALNLSFLANVTNFLWTWTVGLPKAVCLTLSLGLCLGAPQYLLALLCLVGMIWCLRHRGHGWLVLSALLFAIIFCGGAAGTPEVKKLFAGFWYTDPERTASLFTIAVLPLAAAGLGSCYLFLRNALGTLVARGRKDASASAMSRRIVDLSVACVLLIVFFFFNFLPGKIPLPIPGFGDQSAFAITRHALRYESNAANSPLYTAKEARFVEEALELIEATGEEGVIINQPHDGSLFAYPVSDANVFYKSYDRGWKETDESRLIRIALDEIATDPAALEAVKRTGANYVLVLEHDPGENYDSNQWNAEDWKGFDELNDETPGFEAVLADGDMRLYRITALG